MNIKKKVDQKIKLPSNILAEKIVLAGMITNSSLMYKAVGVVESEIFFDARHQEIYDSIVETYKENEVIDILSIMNQLTKKEKFECVAELNDIEKIGRSVVNNEIFEEYLYLLIDKFLRRSIITGTLSLLEMVANEMSPITAVLSQFEALFLDFNQNNSLSTSELQITSFLPSVIKGIEQKYRDNSRKHGLSSGFTSLDKLTEGFQKSDLIIIASRPGMGKTAFVLNIARNIAKQKNTSLAFFSLEMTVEQLGYRILSSESRVPLSKLKTGNISTQEWLQIQGAVRQLSQVQLYIDDTPRITITKLKSKIYKILQNDEKLSAVIVDYLQLIESDLKLESRYQALSSITRSLKIMAREFSIPLIVLSQLSRNLESRNNKRPLLSDLKESGCISPYSYVDLRNKSLQLRNKYNFVKDKGFAVDTKENVVTSYIKRVYVNRNKLTYNLITESGYHLGASANHKILTNRGWRRLSALNLGERLALIKTHQYNSRSICVPQSRFLYKEFEKVESIHVHKKADLFDIEMEELHNFVANKIVVHNSIEQDADLVCMLYREAYYDKEGENNNRAELSILKHRNGPTGTIELKFAAEFAEFTDLTRPEGLEPSTLGFGNLRSTN
nr:DnaB [Porphyrostromium japonicum]